MRSPTTRPVVVTGSDDATVRVWDLGARGLLYQPLEAHQGKVNAVALGNLHGRPIAISGGNDRTVRMWDLLTGRPQGAPLVGHRRRVLAVAVGELGGRPIAVSGGNDDTVRVWDLDAGELVYEPLAGHDGNVLAVAVGRLGGQPIAVSASDDFTVRVWDLAAGGPLGGPLVGHGDWVNAVALGELGGRPIAVSGGIDGTVRVWDLEAGGPLGGPLVHDHFVNAVAVGELHDRSLAASGDAAETVRPVAATTRREAALTPASPRVDQGGSVGSGGKSSRARRRRDHRAAPARGVGAGTTKPRWWQVVPSQLGVVPIILLLVGIFLLGIGVKGLVGNWRFLTTASSANGVVVGVARVVERVQRGSGDRTYYENVTFFHPVVQFVTAREQVVRFQASEGTDKRSTYQVGDSVRILYDPANPRDALLDTWFSRWGDPLIPVAIGLVMVVLVAVIYRVKLRSSGRAARRVAPQSPQQQETDRGADG